MLFIPFIENAFKHAEKKAENAIKVRFIFDEDKLIFVCENKYGSHRDRNGGLGNSLIRRRLSLLYPGRHQLDITAENNIYKAILTLTYAN
jgi:LytS/YehU family sensor histidine kinase